MTSPVAVGPHTRAGRGSHRPIGTVLARTGAALLVATGCVGSGGEPTGEPAAGPGGAFPRTVTHVMGSTEIPAEPIRIVALDQTFVDAEPIVLADTGLARPPSQDVDAFAVEFNQERILDADADHIFLTVAEGDSASVRDRFTSNPLWRLLTGEMHEVSTTTVRAANPDLV